MVEKDILISNELSVGSKVDGRSTQVPHGIVACRTTPESLPVYTPSLLVAYEVLIEALIGNEARIGE